MIRTRIALIVVTTSALLGLAAPAHASPQPLTPAPAAVCGAEPPMVVTLGHLHRWQMGIDDSLPGPC